MSVPEPEEVLVATGDEVESLLRTARAQIAQLSLQLRSAHHEAEQLEAALSEEDTSARDLLRAGLDELIESRRRELDQELEEELARAADVVSAARSEAARIRLTASLAEAVDTPPAEEPAEVTPPSVEPSEDTATRRLQVVAGAEGDDSSSVAEPPSTHLAGEVLSPEQPEPDPVEEAVTDDRAWRAAVPADETEAPDPAPGGDAVVVLEDTADEADAGATGSARGSGPDRDVSTAPSLLHELVSAAVTAAVAQAIAVTGAARPSPRPWTEDPIGFSSMLPVHTPLSRPPLWRRLLHVDVFLPLLLVVIVFVVLLAWVG